MAECVDESRVLELTVPLFFFVSGVRHAHKGAQHCQREVARERGGDIRTQGGTKQHKSK